jgi:hypothetical protein
MCGWLLVSWVTEADAARACSHAHEHAGMMSASTLAVVGCSLSLAYRFR